jgi:hypothetical protein
MISEPEADRIRAFDLGLAVWARNGEIAGHSF